MAARVLCVPADLGGCGSYRIRWPAEALIAQGADIRLVLPDDPLEEQIQAMWIDDGDGVPHVLDVMAPDADVVVLQRPLQRRLADVIPQLQAKGVRVVVEVDDDFDAISPRNVSWPAVQPKLSPGRNRGHLRRACELADWVVVSTPALRERYGRHGRCTVVPNFVPERYLSIEREPRDDGSLYVGWTGSVATHPDDLQVTGGGVARAVRKVSGARVAVVGTGKDVRRNLGLNEDPLACGWREIEDYPDAVAQFDVGIVPLELTRFNEAKSWLKGLEMAALGVPFVASPTQQYTALPFGFPASNAREWERFTLLLLRDEETREIFVEEWREAAARFTIEGNCGQWWDAWTAPLNTRAAVLAHGSN